MQQKAYKYRVYPAEKQRTFFAKCLGTGLQVCRMLAYKLKRKGEKMAALDIIICALEFVNNLRLKLQAEGEHKNGR